jgi:hypothetical protein
MKRQAKKKLKRMETLKVKKRMKRLLVEKNKESDNRQRDKLLIHLLAIKNPHLPAVTRKPTRNTSERSSKWLQTISSSKHFLWVREL